MFNFLSGVVVTSLTYLKAKVSHLGEALSKSLQSPPAIVTGPASAHVPKPVVATPSQQNFNKPSPKVKPHIESDDIRSLSQLVDQHNIFSILQSLSAEKRFYLIQLKLTLFVDMLKRNSASQSIVWFVNVLKLLNELDRKKLCQQLHQYLWPLFKTEENCSYIFSMLVESNSNLTETKQKQPKVISSDHIDLTSRYGKFFVASPSSRSSTKSNFDNACALLNNYVCGNSVKRFFWGHWRRNSHHIKGVQTVLNQIYSAKQTDRCVKQLIVEVFDTIFPGQREGYRNVTDELLDGFFTKNSSLYARLRYLAVREQSTLAEILAQDTTSASQQAKCPSLWV